MNDVQPQLGCPKCSYYRDLPNHGKFSSTRWVKDQEGERLVVTCWMCGYQYTEPCADAELECEEVGPFAAESEVSIPPDTTINDRKSNSPRYVVCKFPSLLGTPWKFRSRLVAFAAGYVRSGFGLRMCEIRLTDEVTGEHLKVW
jgi:hypothetical protein